MRNSERTRLVRHEVAEIERDLKAAADAKAFAAAAPQREAAARARAEELRQLAKDLVTNPEASADLILTQYDGRFASADEVTAGIIAAYNEFMSTNSLTTVQLARLKAILGFQPFCDLSKVEVWQTAFDYMQSLLDPQEPVSVADAEDSTAAQPQPVLVGRAKEKADKAAYEQELANELGAPWNDAVDSIERTSGLVLDQSNRRWLFNAIQNSGLPFTVANIRAIAARQWGAETVGFLNDAEYERYNLNRLDAKTNTAREFARVVTRDGVINNGSLPTGGYRASREGQ